jgi:hypothetical protein
MTYVDRAARAPAYEAVPPAGAAAGPDGEGPRYDLPVKGQGTIGVVLDQVEPFTLVASREEGLPAFRWTIDRAGARLELLDEAGGETELLFIENVGLDASAACPYWFSFDCHNRLVRYGKGEMRKGTMLASCELPPRPEGEGVMDPFFWIPDLAWVAISAAPARGIDRWRDPVTVEPPMRIVPHDSITMEDIAWGRVTVPASLSPTCQKLYDNVAGARFVLDTPDFPEFSAAIEASIVDKDGWCYKTLERKAAEFGKPDLNKTYLRITLGTNQGESPGVPFVMEIWPSGHYSPVHNHGGADAVIRVLHGEITVQLYRFLAPEELVPFATKTFVTEDVTWISARLNQVHKLVNLNKDEPCITIQCYLYAEENRAHWPYFDYVEGSGIGHFDPNSDAEFLEFKQLMQAEWARR